MCEQDGQLVGSVKSAPVLTESSDWNMTWSRKNTFNAFNTEYFTISFIQQTVLIWNCSVSLQKYEKHVSVPCWFKQRGTSVLLQSKDLQNRSNSCQMLLMWPGYWDGYWDITFHPTCPQIHNSSNVH